MIFAADVFEPDTSACSVLAPRTDETVLFSATYAPPRWRSIGETAKLLSTVGQRKRRAMADKKPTKRKVESYQHKDKKRLNNPPVGLVTPETDPEAVRKKYGYDAHLDPAVNLGG